MTDMVSVLLGKEYDEDLKRDIRKVIEESKAIILDDYWGVGPSQNIEFIKFSLFGEVLEIEVATYEGITISGSADAVDNFIKKLK